MEMRRLKIKWEPMVPYLLLVPVLSLLIGVWGYSWVTSFRLTLHRWIFFIDTEPRFIGFQNYLELVRDRSFLKALQNTLVFTASSVFIQLVIGLGIALALDRLRILRAFFRLAVLLPLMLASVLVGLMWKMVLDIDFGILNYAISLIGLPKQGWLTSPKLILPSLIFVQVWRQTPFVTLFLLAGLQELPKPPFEAAFVDGATRLQLLRHLTLPMLRPLIAIVVLFQTAFAIRTFDIALVLARSGGPGMNGLVLGTYLYQRGFQMFRLGYTSTVSYIILFITLAIGLGYLVSLYREVEF